VTVGPVYQGVAQVFQNGVGPVWQGTAAAQRDRGTGPVYQGAAQVFQNGVGPVFQGDADALRGKGVGPVFQGDADALRGHGVGPVFLGAAVSTTTPPLVYSLTPNSGLSLGETCVTIRGINFADEASGGTVRVYFNDVLVQEGGVIDSDTLIVVTPAGPLETVDVRVENVFPGMPETVLAFTLVDAFTYERPNLATRRDHKYDNAVLVVTRTLISELRRTVIQNVTWGMHPEFVDAFSAPEEQEVQSSEPSLKIVGPVIQEDRFYATNGRFQVGPNVDPASGAVIDPVPGGVFTEHVNPVTVRLDYQYVGVGRTKGEAINLWGAITRYFNRTAVLTVPVDGNDPANGTVDIEMSVVWEERAEVGQTNRDGFFQFTGAFVLRGVHTVGEKIFDGVTNDGTNGDGCVILAIEPKT